MDCERKYFVAWRHARSVRRWAKSYDLRFKRASRKYQLPEVPINYFKIIIIKPLFHQVGRISDRSKQRDNISIKITTTITVEYNIS